MYATMRAALALIASLRFLVSTSEKARLPGYVSAQGLRLTPASEKEKELHVLRHPYTVEYLTSMTYSCSLCTKRF